LVQHALLAVRTTPTNRLRQFRVQCGWSLDDVANRLHALAVEIGGPAPGVDRNTVSRWERGVRRPRPHYVQLLGSLYHATPAELGLVQGPQEIEHHVPAIHRLETPATDTVKRRDFLRCLAVGAATPFGLDSEPWTRLLHALQPQGTVNEDSVADVEAATSGFHALEHHVPASHLFGRLANHVNQIAGLLERPMAGPLRKRLTVAAGESAALAGWLAWDLRDRGRAQNLYDTALVAAGEAGDPALQACTLAYRSYMEEAPTSLELLEQARSLIDPDAYPATYAWLSGREAEERAQLGSPKPALNVLDGGLSAHSSAQADQERAWTGFLDSSRMQGFAISTYGRLGQLAEARQAATDALAVLGEQKHSAMILADIADVELQQGHLDEGLQRAEAALDVVVKTEFSVGFERLTKLRHRLRRWAGEPSVRHFEDQLLAAANGWA
jgi:transcriptional regulator with XRE-family HTH domain/tetratricopeptide (TPR) repeat protein